MRVKRSAGGGWGCQVSCPVGPPGPPGPKGNQGPSSTGWGGAGAPGQSTRITSFKPKAIFAYLPCRFGKAGKADFKSYIPISGYITLEKLVSKRLQQPITVEKQPTRFAVITST